MLVLTRRVGDVVAIGDNIKVIVVSINGKQVRLGIEADRSTTIHREEIYQKIKKEARSDGSALIDAAAFSQDSNVVVTNEKRTVIVRKNSVDNKVSDAN